MMTLAVGLAAPAQAHGSCSAAATETMSSGGPGGIPPSVYFKAKVTCTIGHPDMSVTATAKLFVRNGPQDDTPTLVDQITVTTGGPGGGGSSPTQSVADKTFDCVSGKQYQTKAAGYQGSHHNDAPDNYSSWKSCP